jgi:hypothetical protein
MRFTLLLLAALSLYSCSNNSAISKQLSGTDSLVANFTATSSGPVDKTVVTTEPNAIRKVIQFVNGKNVAEHKCGYDGQLLFYANGKAIGDVSFKYTEAGCLHFELEVEGKLQSTKMSNEAADFLKGLVEERSSY